MNDVFEFYQFGSRSEHVKEGDDDQMNSYCVYENRIPHKHPIPFRRHQNLVTNVKPVPSGNTETEFLIDVNRASTC